jgi:hypothetical protein
MEKVSVFIIYEKVLMCHVLFVSYTFIHHLFWIEKENR